MQYFIIMLLVITHHGCGFDDLGDSSDTDNNPNSSANMGGASSSSPNWTYDTIPTECLADELPNSFTAESFFATPPQKKSVTVEFSAGRLTNFDGISCTESITSESLIPEYPGCEQYFICGDCNCQLKVNGASAGNDWVLKCFADDSDSNGCEPYKYVDYSLGQYGASSGGGNQGTGSTNTDSSCSDCLAACDGLPNCCSGTGCSCQDACSYSTRPCPEGKVKCCDGYGFCLCMDIGECPY